MRSTYLLAPRFILPLLMLAFGLLLAAQPVFAQTSPPVAPAAPTAVAVGTQTIELTLTASATTSPPITGYKIERSTDGGTAWVVAKADTGNDKLYYSDMSSSLAGRTAIYRVSGINIFGTGPASANSNVVTLPTAGQQPGVPTGLKATVTPDDVDQITLSWTAPAQGASDISGYIVQHSEKGEQPWTSLVAVTATSATHDAGAGTTRYYRVAATNTQGTGPYSAIVSGTTPPAGVPAPPDSAPTAVAVGMQTVELIWVASATSVTGYKIERSTDGGTTWVEAANAAIGSLETYNDGTDDRVAYSDTHNSLAGRIVIYRVSGINILGTGVASANSNAVTLPTAGQQPDVPTGLTAEKDGLRVINLSWTAPAATGSSAITGYSVQYSEKGEQPWMPVDPLHSGTATTYRDTVDAGTTRHYRVAATNTQGTGPYTGSVLPGPEDQEGAVSLSTQQPVAGTRITATLTDDDGMVSGQMWQWQKSMNKTYWMDITGAMAMSYTPAAMDVGYYLRVMVTYTDKNRSDRIAESMATDDAVTLPPDQDGMVTLSTQKPLVGMAINASLTDADGMISGEEWQWQKSMGKTSWTDITGATAMNYTPPEADEGYYLQATVTYTDKYRSSRTASSMATDMVTVPSDDASLASLSLMDSDGVDIDLMDMNDMSVAFAPDTRMYYADVANDVDMIEVMAAAMDSNAMVSVMYGADDMMATMMDGGGYSVPLMAGENTVKVNVTAEDGTTMMPYTVMVDRAVMMTLFERYDANDNMVLDKGEILKAIDDYLNHRAISKEQVLELIKLYLSGTS